MTEFESPQSLVAARATTLARATSSRLDGPDGVERPGACESGFGGDDVGLPSLVAALVAEAAADGASVEATSPAVRTGVAVEALDRQGHLLATGVDVATGSGDGTDAVTGVVLWCDWLHARAYQLLLGTSGSGERVVSAVRTMGRAVASRNRRRECADDGRGPLVALPSRVVDDEAVSVFVRSGGCSCATAARIGGLVGGAESDAVERAVAYGEVVDDLVRADERRPSSWGDGTVESDDDREGDAAVSGDEVGVVGTGVGEFEAPLSNTSPDSVCWSALWWLLVAVDGDVADVEE